MFDLIESIFQLGIIFSVVLQNRVQFRIVVLLFDGEFSVVLLFFFFCLTYYFDMMLLEKVGKIDFLFAIKLID